MADRGSNTSGDDSRPWYVQLLIVVAPIVVLIGLPLAGLDMVGRSALRDELEAIRLAGGPANHEELEARLPDVPDYQNAASLVYSLADRLNQVNAACEQNLQMPLFRSRDLPELGGPYPAEAVSAMETLLAEHAELLAAIDSIRDRRRGALPLELLWSPQPNSALSSFRTAAKLKAMDAIRKARAGGFDPAAADSVTMLRVGGAIAETPALLAALIAMACDTLAVSSLERVLSAGVCRDETLAEVDRAVAEALASRSMVVAIHGERVALIELIVNGRPLPGMDTELKIPGRSSLGRGWSRREAATALELLAPLADPGASVRDAIAAARTYDAKVEALPRYRALAKAMLPQLQRVYELHGRRVAALRCARAAIAAERYRLRAGHWPEALASLVPDYLDPLPTDPFDEQPLRYLRTEGGVTIYSIGEDETDDGGRVDRQPPPNRRAPDTGFRLLDPAQRGFTLAGAAAEQESPTTD